MTTLVFDCEADGLLYEATQLWCICVKDVQGGDVEEYYGDTLEAGLDRLLGADVLICHNLISYDIPLLKKLYTIDFKCVSVIDTLLLSQLLNPDRWGGHGLAAWGERAGREKPPIDDWSKFSMDLVHRCSEDVEINLWAYNELIREAGEPIEGVRVYG